MEQIEVPVTIAERTFTVTFVMDGGTIVDSNNLNRETIELVEDSEIFTGLTYSKPGYRFDGWYTDSSYSTLFSSNGEGAVMPSNNLTLYAKWTALSYKVNFNANGGNVDTDSITALSNVELGTLPIPTRTYNGSFLLSGTTADMMNPIIDSDSLKISNSNPNIGEMIEISVKVSDNKKVKDVIVTYNSPSMNSSEQITMMFDSSKNSYIGYLTVKENMEFGKWSVSYIWASDEVSNIAYAYPENGFFELSEKSIVLGDINFDGTINSLDALAVLQHSVGQIMLNDRKFIAGDVNRNNAINSADALL